MIIQNPVNRQRKDKYPYKYKNYEYPLIEKSKALYDFLHYRAADVRLIVGLV
jgi:hypothetical protein